MIENIKPRSLTKIERGHLRRAGVWMNAIVDAWNMGEAPWAYDENGSITMQIQMPFFNALTEKSTDEDHERATLNAANAVQELARCHGIDPKRHKWHGR